MKPLDDSSQQILLRLARAAVRAAVAGGQPPDIFPIPQALLEPAGAFVTLRRDGRLRGCIGHIFSDAPLEQTVRECAASSALRDPRFHPVVAQEVPRLQIEISVLSPLFDIAPGEIEVGKHGLIVSKGWKRGLLLPQVAVEWKWDRERFLEETCLKAGLEPDDWKLGARIQGFTAQVFGEAAGLPVPVPATLIQN